MKTAKVILKSAVFSLVLIIYVLIVWGAMEQFKSLDSIALRWVLAMFGYSPVIPITYLFYYPVRGQCDRPWLYTVTTVVSNIAACCIIAFCFRKGIGFYLTNWIIPIVIVTLAIVIITLCDTLMKKEKQTNANQNKVLITVLKSCIWALLLNVVTILPSVYVFNTLNMFESINGIQEAMCMIPCTGITVLALIHPHVKGTSSRSWLHLVSALLMHFLCQFLWLFIDLWTDWTHFLLILPYIVIPGYMLIILSVLFDLVVAIRQTASDKKKKKLMSEGKPLTVIEETETV